jgi:hypothetical protein
MHSTTVWRGTVLFVLWGYGLWYSWMCAGLSGDGSYFMYEVVRTGGFLFELTRAFPAILSEIPLVLGVQAGITDLQWLARLHSFGWFALPAGLYTAALLRARHDAVLQAAVVAALALVFMTSSFHIVSEHIPSYAAALVAAVWLITAERLRVADGLFLAAIGVFSLSCYESFVYFGPLLAGLTLWTVRRTIDRTSMASRMFVLAAALFVLDGLASVYAIATFGDDAYVFAALREVRHFWKNPIFVLSLAAAGGVLLWALFRPGDLAGYKPYGWAAPAIAALLLAPLLVEARVFGPYYAYTQNITRISAGVVIVAVIVFMWAHRWPVRLAAFAILASPAIGRRLLAFACVILVATLPWNLTLVRLYVAYLDAVQEATRAAGGVVAFEATQLPHLRRLLQGETWQLSYTSAIVQCSPAGAIIAPPQDMQLASSFAFVLPKHLIGYRWGDCS